MSYDIKYHPTAKDIKRQERYLCCAPCTQSVSQLKFFLFYSRYIDTHEKDCSEAEAGRQQGDVFNFKTLNTFRNYTVSFKADQDQFQEFTVGLDNRHVKVRNTIRSV